MKKLNNISVIGFNESGSVISINNNALNLLGIKSENEAKFLNFQQIFEVEFVDIKNNLYLSNEISEQVSIISRDNARICASTTFLKTENTILTISVPLLTVYESDRTIDKLTHTLGKISEVLNFTRDLDDVLELVLNDLKLILNFDKALIMFLDGDSLVLKASRNMIDCFDNEFRKNLLSGSTLLNRLIKSRSTQYETVLESTPSIINELGVTINPPYSFIAAPLTIRDTLFGIVVLIKEEKDYFSAIDASIATAFASSAAYSVKDAELSNVFKMQLKILKENIIERTKALEVIKDQNLKILEADKIKNEFLANMSHELRTPLNAIIGFSEALKLKIFGALNEKQEEYIDDIHASGVHLLGMINDLLDLSKIEAKKMQIHRVMFNVLQAVNEVINVIGAIANKKNIRISVTCDDKNLEINADHRKFQQILYNLLSNAIKFTPENGSIEIGISLDNDHLRIFVKDDGIGIDPDYHDKIFAKFQQVDNSYSRKQGSTGLGLTITKELIEMHGGKIWVESEQNKGAKFSFLIPIIDFVK